MAKLDEVLEALGPNTERDAYYNLEGAIADIEHAKGVCDDISLRTLRRVASQLAQAEKALETRETEGT